MRQLVTNDIFKMSRIFKKLNIRLDEILGIGKKENDDASDEKFAINLIQKLAENACLAQDEINDFIGSLSGMTGEAFGNLLIKESQEIIKQFRELDGVADFFKLAGRLMK